MTCTPLLILSLLAATTTAAPPATNAPTASAPTPPVLHEISPGVFDYKGIRLDKKNHRVTFPATVNQVQGLIEYLLVNEKGKVHESLFATKIIPHDLHLAMLLVGLKEDESANANEALPPTAIDSAYLNSAPKLKGAPVRLSVAWTKDGKRHEAGADEWILNLQTNHLMSPGPWTYNGSMVEDGAFVADQEFSIVAVITDPTALVNNPRPGYDNDQIWQVRTEAVPPMNTPVDITVTLTDTDATK